MHNTQQQKNKSLKLSKQALGTLERSIEMIEQGEYCPDIIQQLDSAIGLIRSARRELLAGHLEHCVQENWSKDSNKLIKELIKVYRLQN